MFNDIIGHKRQKNILKRILESEKIPHALLFVGPEKLGKKLMARNFASLILKQNPSDNPDFIFIEALSDRIQIDQIRRLNWKLSLKPVKAPMMVAIVDNADLMTREAQNSFLKTLEEPKAKSLLILTAKDIRFFLPTIVSRCEIVRFSPVSNKEIINYLEAKELSDKEIGDIIDISLSVPGIVIDILNDNKILEKRKNIISELIKLTKSPLTVRFDHAEKLAKSDNLMEVLGIWLSYFRKRLFEDKNKISLLKIKTILEAIQETIFTVSATNANTRLALEVLVAEF